MEKKYNPPRIIGRVPDELWNKLKHAAQLCEMNFTEWAVSTLEERADLVITTTKYTRTRRIKKNA